MSLVVSGGKDLADVETDAQSGITAAASAASAASAAQTTANAAIPLTQKAAASGVASLNGASLVVQEPASKAQASGIASLNGSSLVVQDPASKGQASGLATLDGTTKVPAAQLTGVLASTDLTNNAALEKTANKGVASGYASLDGSVLLPLTQLSNFVPRWVKATKAFSDLAVAALNNDIEIYSLPAGGVIHATKIKHGAAFSGGAISAYTASVGISGNLTKYSGAGTQDVFQAPGDTVQRLDGVLGTESQGAVTSIRLAVVSVGDNLDQATTGSVTVWLLVSIAN